MDLRFLIPPIVAALLLGFVPANGAAEPEAGQGDEQLLRAAGLSTDGAGLLAFFQMRTQAAPGREQLEALIRQMGDKRDKKGQQVGAFGQLVALGPVGVPLLRQAAKDVDDVTTATLAQRCLDYIEGLQAPALPVAAAHLLTLRRPEGAAEVLLDYLPAADDEHVLDEVRTALVTLAERDGKPDRALVKALEDPVALRRAAAVEALSCVIDAGVHARVAKLLNDSQPVVRLRAALALARTSHDPEAISTLIALLTDAPPEPARDAEEFLANLANEQAPRVALGTDDASRLRCRDAWAAWWHGTEKANLLDEVRRRTLQDGVRARAVLLIGHLGDDSFDVREKALTDLVGMGPSIAPLLRQHLHDSDPEISGRVKKALEHAEKVKSGPLLAVVVRLVALRRPAGSAEALLAFLPFAEDETILSEVQSTLAALAMHGGNPEPALVKALDDKLPLRRAVAAAALTQGGVREQRAAVHRMLRDTEPAVRLRVAQALAGVQDKEAVPALIALLADLPAGQAGEVEDYLRRLAGEQAPRVGLGTDVAGRRQCRDAWVTWWHDHEANISLPRAGLPSRYLGYTLIVFLNPARVVELGADNKLRWEINGLSYAYDACALPGDRILIAEYSGGRVTERTSRNEVIWEKRVGQPLSCQRLLNGHTFIASRNQFVEVDATGKDVSTVARTQSDVMAAQKLRDGSILCVTLQGICQRLDAAGKELKSFSIGQVSLGGLEVLPNGRFLVAQSNMNRVAEFDPDGKMVWEANAQVPTSASRLPNGNTLVASQGMGQVVELDRHGKTVWEYKNGQQPWKARRR